jgi:hypothetical protein
MGGHDRLNDYKIVVNNCFKNKITLLAINRGKTKLGLGSSDLMIKIFQKLLIFPTLRSSTF